MSKQLGNSPDALKLIDVYGADAVRVGLMLSSAAGNDLLFDESLCQQGKNFANKIWNAYRLITGWEIDENITASSSAKEALKWYENQFGKTLVLVDENFQKYRISDALMSIYKLIWEDFCSWLLELIKPNYGQPIDRETYKKTIVLFENNLRLLHPFMPFLSEELWHFIKNRNSNEALAISSWPSINKFDLNTLENFEKAKEVVVGIRNFRKEKNISLKEKIDLFVTKSSSLLPFEASIIKLGVISTISYGSAPKDIFGRSFRFGTFELFIPSNLLEDSDAERKKINEELTYAKGFLASVEKKLLNKSFVSNAPEGIINIERKKMSDIKQKIILLEKSLAAL